MYFRILLFIFVLSATTGYRMQFTSFDSVKIAYTDERQGEPIILTRDFINTSASFNGTVLKEQLLAKGYSVIAPDLRGTGKNKNYSCSNCWKRGWG